MVEVQVANELATFMCLTVEYCPTGDVLADYFTKPLLSGIIDKFHDIIMNSCSNPA